MFYTKLDNNHKEKIKVSKNIYELYDEKDYINVYRYTFKDNIHYSIFAHDLSFAIKILIHDIVFIVITIAINIIPKFKNKKIIMDNIKAYNEKIERNDYDKLDIKELRKILKEMKIVIPNSKRNDKNYIIKRIKNTP